MKISKFSQFYSKHLDQLVFKALKNKLLSSYTHYVFLPQILCCFFSGQFLDEDMFLLLQSVVVSIKLVNKSSIFV